MAVVCINGLTEGSMMATFVTIRCMARGFTNGPIKVMDWVTIVITVDRCDSLIKLN